MSAVVRFGLVGAGAIAQAYGEAIEGADGVELTAVADLDSASAERLAAGSGAKPFSSHLDLAASGLCDAVIVATPPVSHEEVVLDLVELDLPVLCEKPFATNGVSARRMASAASDRGVLVSMASKFRYVADVRVARQRIAAGDIGDIKLIENVFTGVVDMTGRWNSDPEVSGGGVLIDNGTHSVDIVRFLTGRIASVSAVTGPRIQPVEVEDHVFVSAMTECGVLARVETSWSLHKDRSDYFALYGTEGVIELGWKSSRIRQPLTGTWQTLGTGYNKVAAFTDQVLDFAAGVRGETPKYLAMMDDIFASVDVVSAAYTSMAEDSRWIDVQGVTEGDRRPPRRVVS